MRGLSMETLRPGSRHAARGASTICLSVLSPLVFWGGLAAGCADEDEMLTLPAENPDPEAPQAESVVEAAAAQPNEDMRERAPVQCQEPLDLTLVLDVSTSMGGELGAIADGVDALWAAAQSDYTDVRFRMVAFVDDATTVDNCAPFESPEAMRDAVVHWQRFASGNRQLVTPGLSNHDCPENSLDALALALKSCDLRPEARKLIVHITDDTFVEAPGFLSQGSVQIGIPVEHTYADIATLVTEQDVYVSVFALREPRACGAGGSSEVASGFFTPRGGIAPLPELVGGNATDLRRVRDGEVDLAAAIIADSSAIKCGGLI